MFSMDSKLTYFGAGFLKHATFRPAFTDLEHALVVACGLTWQKDLVVGGGQFVSLITIGVDQDL